MPAREIPAPIRQDTRPRTARHATSLPQTETQLARSADLAPVLSRLADRPCRTRTGVLLNRRAISQGPAIFGWVASVACGLWLRAFAASGLRVRRLSCAGPAPQMREELTP
jgi:hypothetical protein